MRAAAILALAGLLFFGLSAKAQAPVGEAELRRYLQAKLEMQALQQSLQQELDSMRKSSGLDQEAWGYLRQALIQARDSASLGHLSSDFSAREIRNAYGLLQAQAEVQRKLPAYQEAIARHHQFSYDDFQYLDLQVEALPELRARVAKIWQTQRDSTALKN